MAKKVLITEEDEQATNGLLVLFFIIVAIFIGGLSFIAGIIYTSYLDGNREDECENVTPIEKIIEENKIEDYLITDEKLLKELDEKVDKIKIVDEGYSERYIYNYLEDSKNYYVLVAYGYYEINGKNKIVYTGFDKKNIYKELSSKEELKIDDSNYSEFSKYKVTFAKDGNDSYFKGIERIE